MRASSLSSPTVINQAGGLISNHRRARRGFVHRFRLDAFRFLFLVQGIGVSVRTWLA